MNTVKIFLLFFLTFESSTVFSQNLYDIDSIVILEFTFPEKDWQYPLHYYHSRGKDERHIADLVINGEKFDSVAVKFKGQSSYSRNYAKNPLSIGLNEWKKQKYHGVKNLKLSNGNLDPSWLREVLAYQIARKYMVAPHSNYAQVFTNGKYHGLFGNTESVNGAFIKRYLNAGKNNTRFKGNAPTGRFSGGPSSLEYLGDDPAAYHRYYELKSKDSNSWKELVKLIRAISQEPEKVEEILDINSAIWMLAFNNVLLNLDSYSDFRQNYYLVQDNNGRFHFILWDLNLSFDGLGKSAGVTMQPDYNPSQFQENKGYPLINLVLNNPTYRKMYFAHCKTILEENISNDWYKTEAQKHAVLIDEAVKRDSNWYFTYDDFKKNITQTVVREEPAPFPYPGIVEVMDARMDFLQNHPEYNKQQPVFEEAKTRFQQIGSLITLRISVAVSNAEQVFLMYRENEKELFQKIKMKESNGLFLAEMKLFHRDIEYYFYSENQAAGAFSPKRAAKEFFILE